MSRDFDDPTPRRPAGPKRNPQPRSSPPDPLGAEESTWRPADQGSRTSRGGSATSEPPAVEGRTSWSERLVFGSVSAGQMAVFCRQAAHYLDAGVDLHRSLTSLAKQFAGTPLGPVLTRLHRAIRQGDSLTEAIDRESKAFDPLFRSMIRVAEARGGVPETLRELSRHYEARQRLFRQARAALIYPAAVLIVAGAVALLLTFFVLPVFVGMLADAAGGQAANLPLPTRLLMAFTRFATWVGWWAFPLSLIVAIFALVRFYRTAAGKAMLDGIALRLPVLGKLLRMLDTTRFTRSLSVLLEGGVDIGTSLDLAGEVVRLHPYRTAVENAREMVMEGTELSQALAVSHRFEPDVIAVVGSGEETGKLPESLERLADEYEERVTYMVKNLGSLIQPLIVVALGAMVLFIILALFLPYLAIITSLTR